MVVDRQSVAEDGPPAAAGGSSALVVYLTYGAVIASIVALIWGLSDAGRFWPPWVLFGLGVPAALRSVIQRARRRDRGARLFFAVAAIASVLSVMMVLI